MLYSLFLCGLIIGTALTQTFPVIKNIISDYFDSAVPILYVFLKNISIYFSAYIFLFVTGLCSIGTPFIMAIPIMTGIFYSSVFVSFYSASYSYGLLLFLLLKLPSAILFVITVFLSVIISLDMVKMIKNAVFTSSATGVEFKHYIISYIILMVFGLFSAVIDAISAIIVNSFLC